MVREPNMLKNAIKMFIHPFYVIRIIGLFVLLYSERSVMNVMLFSLIVMSIFMTNIQFYIRFYKEEKLYAENMKYVVATDAKEKMKLYRAAQEYCDVCGNDVVTFLKTVVSMAGDSLYDICYEYGIDPKMIETYDEV